MKTQKISEAVVRRLPIYLRYLNELSMKNVSTVSSQDLGQKLDLNPAQIRKDLAYFGEFGKKGIGYDISYLIEKIRQILKLDRHIQVALVGAGNLGRALCNYNTYLRNDMKIVALFDAMPEKAGEMINNLIVQPMSEMKSVLSQLGVRIGIITVPAAEAQNVANQFVDCGIEAILNFAPVIIKVPAEVRVHYADFTTELQSLAYYLD
ncbi:redox-sensing transcriptional repressor Rex [Paenibacillus marchantiophytorum]|uniref:Redox-sensing transcriptional repressor Rex n=1 Tax=Paenibacillus marchantiophytorum TaxID=1619310 RepID=A0ABQ1EW35_9BACL|nr:MULTISPECIES: redox-sensing transcriptional repressor Rex [Paenibacillus]UKS30562.1 redox-sensing transcriptional repressor Rex [Paenibacillus sp. HWE-109]GFZ89992.1 redox-sensing transcriptional repressor Rex [Paenibacillus marchantiophytorum]